MTREEAIDILRSYLMFDKSNMQIDIALNMAIEALSAVAVQGEWIEREDWDGDYYYDCSVCGESFVLCDGTPSMNLYHFCPNCGARMENTK